MREFLRNDKGLSLKLSSKTFTFQHRDDLVRERESKQVYLYNTEATESNWKHKEVELKLNKIKIETICQEINESRK